MNAERAVRTALLFEAELDEWAANLPAKWSSTVRESDSIHYTFYGKYHIYRDI
jgi:hypothetical protein